MIAGALATLMWVSMLTAPWQLAGGLLDACGTSSVRRRS